MAFDLTISDANGGGTNYANDNLFFGSQVTFGPILLEQINSDTMEIEGSVSKSDIIPVYYNYSINSVDKFLWTTQDGFFYSTPTITHSFESSGLYTIAITITSEQQFFNGIPFHFKYTFIKNVQVTSFFSKIIIKNMPMWEYETNQATMDMVTASASFFDRMYKDIKNLYNLIDIEHVDPKYFEYLAVTLGHDVSYANKVGGNINDDKFEQYDIFQRIKNNIATPTEINNFRQFLLLSVDIFKTGGTPAQVTKFLSLFSIDAKSIDLWTQYWGIKAKGLINETFCGLANFEDNKLGLKWNDVKVVGNNNDQGHLINKFNSFVIDSYHTVQKLEYPNDAISEDVDYAYFRIYHITPIFKEVRRDNGNVIVSEEITSDYYDIVANNDTDSATVYPWLLKIKKIYLEDGDVLSASFEVTPEITVDSIVACVDTKRTIKNMDFEVKFKYLPIHSAYENNNVKSQENEIFLAFRGISTSSNVYDNFSEYYRLSLNAKRSTVSLSKVVTNPVNGEVITQKINLNQVDGTNPIFDKLILDSNSGEISQFNFNSAYDIKLSIVDSTISAYYKESTEFNEIVRKIESDEGEVPFGQTLSAWSSLFENVNIDVTDVNVFSTDNTEEAIPTFPYSAILTDGLYGVGSRNSIVEILEASINNLDLDNSLYTDTDKEINLKPKYLEWQNNKLLIFNSYKDNKTNTFSKTISNSFDPTVSQYTLETNEANAFNYLYVDNAPVTEEIASRFTVTFDQNWVNQTFKNEQDVMDKIIVPFGSQSSWFAVESRTYDKEFYKNYFGETSSSHDFGTTENPNLISAPSFFSYNLSTPLGLYKVEPLDAFSSVTRIDIRDSAGILLNSTFQANDKISEYKYSNNAIRMRGLYEEVCPNSASFTNGNSFENTLFFPIIFNTANSNRTLGVRFKNCSDIRSIITRVINGREGTYDIQLYGLFILQLPLEAVKFRPDLSKNIEIYANDPSTVLVKMFVPLGVLNPEIQNYSLSTEYMHDIDSTGPASISLDSVYTRIPREIMIYKEQDNIFELANLNPYENDETSSKCKYYLSADLNLSTTLSDYEKPMTGIAYKYMMHYDVRKMLDTLIKDNTKFNSSFLWWVPKELWRKRDFVVLGVDSTNDISTGLNFDGSSDKYFYGKKVSRNSQLNSLRIQLKDGPVTPYTTYYAKIKFRMSWSGFDELLLGNASLVDGSVKPARPLSSEEAAKLITVGGKAEKYINSIPAPVGECMDFYVPIAWYPEGEIPPNDVIQWGNYIKGVNGDTFAPSVSLTPYGLMTYFIMHATNANHNVADIAAITSGWSIQDWNDRFMQFVSVEYVAETIPSSVYKLYNDYGFVSNYASMKGAKIEIEYDAGSIPDWKVIETATMFPNSYNSYYFTIPEPVFGLAKWSSDIVSIKASNYIIPFNLYSFNSNILSLNNDNIFNIIKTSQLKVRLSFDVLFSQINKNVLYVDDFYETRQISWINYQENHIKDVLELAVRIPSQDLFLTGYDPLLKIKSINGTYVLTNTSNTTTNKYDPLLSGVSYNNIDSVSITKDDNGGYPKTVSLIDEQNDIYQLETFVMFDPTLDTTKSYNGKKFEYIIKAENSYNASTNSFILSSYYFVGIGTYNFDIALGVAKFNPTTNKMEKTFLAGYGDYNNNNIKTNMWYKLKVVADSNYIRVIFNEETEAEKMVIKYNIDVNYQKDINKYLSGQFEELVYLVTGLDKLKITYPDHLQSIAGSSFFNNNWNETWAANIRPIGPYACIKLFNPYTYIRKVSYLARIQDDKTFATSNELVDLNGLVLEIEKNYKVSGIIETVGKLANGSIVVKYGSDIFHKIPNRFVDKKYSGVQKVYIADNKVVIKFDSTNKLALAIADETFTTIQNVYIKDNYFNTDHIYKYMVWTERDIDEIYANPSKIYITFKDV